MFILIIELNNIFKFNISKPIYLMVTFHLCYKKLLLSTLPCLDLTTKRLCWMFCFQFEGVGPIEGIRGLHHIKRWAENTLGVGGGGCFRQK
jgi:hypothetical protein